MKRIVFTILMALVTLSVSAQEWGPSGYGNRFSPVSDGALQKGYRGIVEMGHGFTTDICYINQFTISQGYQFNPYLYWGGFTNFGLGCLGDAFAFQFGSDFRVYMSKGKVAPFITSRVGGYVCWDCGIYPYLDGSLGLRIALNNNFGLNFAFQAGSGCCWDGAELLFKVGFEF